MGGISLASFFAGIMILRWLTVFMDANPCGINRQVGRWKICPAAGVVVGNTFTLAELGLVSVTTENAIRLAQACMQDGAGRYLRGKAQPAGIQAIQEARKRLASEIKFLQLQMEKRPH